MDRNARFCLIVYLLIRMLASYFVKAEQLHSVPGEYIVHLVDHRAEDIQNLVPGSHVVRVYSIGSEKFALIKIDRMSRTSDDNISDHSVVMHPNRIFYPMYVDEKMEVECSDYSDCNCHEQVTGSKYWGLTRISSHDLPHFYSSDSYVYNDTGQSVTVFIMDSGVNVKHETFGGRARVGYTVQDLRKSEGEKDLHGHGTAVASVIAGSRHGVAKQAYIVSVKVMNRKNNGNEAWILEGLDWISKKINQSSGERFVINLSLASSQPLNHGCSTDPLCRALDEMNAVVVVAAGNDDGSGERLDSCKFIPARFSNVISVAATTRNDELWERTSRGPCVDMLAPGHEILAASHMDITSEEKKTGSSFASPFVAGVVARHLENYNYQLSTQAMLQLLNDTATRGKTNAQDYNTSDYLVYIDYPAECRVSSAPDHVTVVVSIIVVIEFVGVLVFAMYCRQQRKPTRVDENNDREEEETLLNTETV